MVSIGSTHFRAEFEEAFRREEHAGNICLMVPCYKDDPCCKDKEAQDRLDHLHLAKIDLANACGNGEAFVVNLGGYIGASARAEIEYVRSLGMAIRSLEPVS